MGEFLDAARSDPLLQRALLAGVLASVSCAIVGSFVVVRRISYLAGGISHSVLGGLGLAVYLQRAHGAGAWAAPLHGAMAAALLSAAVIGVVSLRFRQRQDTVISALWSVGMAAGLLFLALTPGYHEDLMSYLFGSISMVGSAELRLLALLDLAVVTVTLGCYRAFVAVCFDEEYARTRGVRVEFYYLLLLGLTALTVVLLMTVVGIVMVIALLTLPAAIAGQFTRRLPAMILLSAALILLFTTGGQALSYGPGLPPGAVIILLAGVAYLATLLFRRLRGAA
jgi:zinc transport system permease protein